MKFVFLLCSVLILSFCSQNTLQNNNSSTNLLQDNATENNSTQLPKETNQAFEKYRLKVKKELADKSKTLNLVSLETAKVMPNDLEARFSRDSAWWKSQLFILKKSDGNWTAEFQKQTFYDGTWKLKKLSKTKLQEPKSGWENVWKKLTDKELLTLPDGLQTGGGFEPGFDSGGVTIETNVGGNYRFCLYTDPTPQHQVRETMLAIEMIDIIRDEFSLKDFNISEPIE